MNSEDIREKAAWLEKLTGFKSDTPIETANDLRIYASRADFYCHLSLTGAEVGEIAEMVESLDPPEVRQARERKRQRSEERAEARMNWRFDRGRTLSKLGAAARKTGGDETRLSYDFSRREGEKEPLGEGGGPLDSGEGRIGSSLTV